jgi:hypothetical protein
MPAKPDEPPVPALRASDAERDSAADLLRDATVSGRLSVDELDERLHEVLRAPLREDLDRLVADVRVPDDRHPVKAGSAPVPAVARVTVRAGDDGTRRLLSILGGSQRRGRWRLAARCSVVNVLGGSELDLSTAELASDRVELRVVSVLGGAEITLPQGMNVEISQTSLLGGNAVDVDDEHPDPGGPVVHLRLISILGGVEIRRGRKLTRGERREQRVQAPRPRSSEGTEPR